MLFSMIDPAHRHVQFVSIPLCARGVESSQHLACNSFSPGRARAAAHFAGVGFVNPISLRPLAPSSQTRTVDRLISRYTWHVYH